MIKQEKLNQSILFSHSICLLKDVKRAIELLEKLQMSSEVPATKLSALQKVLQSDFLNAVREVYEHVYETVDIQGSLDVRASATAKACVAAFAASEGHAHPRVVELPKTDEGLGFNVMGGREQNSPVSYKVLKEFNSFNSLSYFNLSEFLKCQITRRLNSDNDFFLFQIYISRIIPGGVADRHGNSILSIHHFLKFNSTLHF